MKHVNHIVIISAFKKDLELEYNELNHTLLKSMIKDLGCVPVECNGVYMGTKEKSLYVLIKPEHLVYFQEFRGMFDQECFLYRDSSGLWSLEYEGKTELLGTKEKYSTYPTSNCTELSTGRYLVIGE